jgi:hypothetical protein
MFRSMFAIAVFAVALTSSTFADDQARPREYQPRTSAEGQSPDLRDGFKWIGRQLKKGFGKVTGRPEALPTPPPPPPQQSTSSLPNLVGVVSEASVQDGRIAFTLQMRNTGATPARSDSRRPLRIKPFLLPTAAGKDGIVLDWKEFPVDLDSQGSMTYRYEGSLPKVPRGEYYLSVVINSNARQPGFNEAPSIMESSQLDNATDLVALGAFESTNETPIAPGMTEAGDLVTNPGDSMQISRGVISHDLLTVSYGRSSSPTVVGGTNSRRLWGRFMMASLETKKVYTVPYRQFSESEPEKQWYALVWPAERLASGYRYTDTYGQRTIVEGLPPGNYKYLTMINSKDEVVDANPYNNLDVREVEIRATRADAPAVWVVAPNRQVPATTVAFKSDYSRGTTAAPRLSDEVSSWISLAGSPNATGFGQFQLSAGASGAAEGAYDATVKISTQIPGTQYYGAPDTFESAIPVRTFVQGSQAPGFSLSQQAIDVRASYEDLQGAAGRKTFSIRNTGQARLEWMAYFSREGALPNWVKVTPASGSVEPGQSQDVTVEIDPEGVRLGYSVYTELKFLTNVPRASQLVSPSAQPSLRLSLQVLRVLF